MRVVRYGKEIDLSYEHKTQCPKCAKKGNDRGADNLHVYGVDDNNKHLGAYCWSCEFTIPSEEFLEGLEGSEVEEEDYDIMGKEFTRDLRDKMKEATGMDSRGYRGITKETSAKYRVRYQYDESSGEVTDVFYPTTKDYKLVGYKVRKHPKDFTQPIGEVGKECDLFGQFLFKTNANFVVVTGGEHDALSAYQMLNKGNSKYDDIACVSSTIGESGTYKQAKPQYEWLNRFKKVVVCLDNDEAGRRATEKLVESLPRGKVYIMKLRHKDPNEYLLKGKEQDFINDFWKADYHTPAGVHSSLSAYDALLEYSDVKQLSLPPFLKKAQDMFDGGLVRNTLSNIFAKSSSGKSLFVDSCACHWIMNEPDDVVGVMSLEAARDQWFTNIVSHHLGKRLIHLKGEERKAYLMQEDVKAKIKDFTQREDGSPRFYVYDERGADIEIIKESVVEMIVRLGVTILVVDVYSDLLDGMDNSKQEEVSSWLKRLVKEYTQVTVVLISHTRKDKQGSSGALTEDSIMGSSTVFKSMSQSISIERDKLADNDFLRNCSFITVHKNRYFSDTGPAGIVFFDKNTSKLYDLDDYLEQHPEMRPTAEEALGGFDEEN